tara:strand:+ start:1215 stop:1466 length:252 start_codon:yes stop_codon:yes gene_type:complete
MPTRRRDLIDLEKILGKVKNPPVRDNKYVTRVSDKYKVGDYVEEYEFEEAHKKQHGKFPQLSVQDYTQVKEDDKGKYVEKRTD